MKCLQQILYFISKSEMQYWCDPNMLHYMHSYFLWRNQNLEPANQFFDPNISFFYPCPIEHNRDHSQKIQEEKEVKQESSSSDFQEQTQRQLEVENSQKRAPKKKQVKSKKIKVQKKVLLQKAGRNSVSNILRTFLKWLLNEIKHRSSGIFQKISKHHHLSLSLQELYQKLNAKNIDNNNYIRPTSMRWILAQRRPQDEFPFAIRILLKVFLETECRPRFLTSVKMKAQELPHYLKNTRQFFAQLSGENQQYK